jgi:hypothetical protein
MGRASEVVFRQQHHRTERDRTTPLLVLVRSPTSASKIDSGVPDDQASNV